MTSSATAQADSPDPDLDAPSHRPKSSGPSPAIPCPLCVDLDGTLLRTDTLAELVLQLLRRNPAFILLFPLWLLRGRADFKRQVAQRTTPTPQHWPWRPEVLELLRAEGASGRRLVLATAADERVAQAVATHLGLFDEVHASADGTNLKGEAKAARLVARFGRGGFDYIGDSRADLPVWREARAALIAGTSDRVAAQLVAMRSGVTRLSPRDPSPALALLRLTRPHQWLKNLLLLVPLLTAHRVGDGHAWIEALRAIIAMSFVCASVYVVNDLADVASDRAHPTKRWRPLAHGDVQPLAALWLALGTGLIGWLLALTLPAPFTAWVAAYVAGTVLYSWRLKRLPGVDVVVLAFLYTVRVLLGAAAIAVPASPWLLLFVALFFLGLALLKRFTELDAAVRADLNVAPGRGYRLADRHRVRQVGIAVGVAAALVLLFYAFSDAVAVLYARPVLLAGLAPLVLLWTARAWRIASGGTMHDDPLVHALRDPASYLVLAGMVAITYAAT